jgi:hypothetical protein
MHRCADGTGLTSCVWRSPRSDVEALTLAFSVSRDEEVVRLCVLRAGVAFDLGERAHHYVLLTLARRRLADAAGGFQDHSCGWVYQEDLARDPSMTGARLNLAVFRIRKQFAGIDVADPEHIVERRRSTGQLRIGTSRAIVHRL